VNSKTVPSLNDIDAGSMKAVTAGKTLYGLPTSNYTQGLIYNRKLFQEAGLNPDQPPTTWADVEKDATAIAKLGNGIQGWGDYSAGNTAAGTSPRTSTPWAARWSTTRPLRRPRASTP